VAICVIRGSKKMRKQRRQKGFTLVELLIALMVVSVVLSAAAVLANAAASADTQTDRMGRSQTHLRQVTARVTDLIRRANRVTAASADEFTLWLDVNADGLATADELVRIARGADGHALSIGAGETHSLCRNVSFAYDQNAPDTRFVTIWFDLEESGLSQRRSICAGLRASDAHMQ
jgi:prepilin-type N-terminal cleavage/methylation domain-containing protein